MDTRKDYSGCREQCLSFLPLQKKKFLNFTFVYILTNLTVYRCTNSLWVWHEIISSLIPIIEITTGKKIFAIKTSLVLSVVLITKKKSHEKQSTPKAPNCLQNWCLQKIQKVGKKVVILTFTTVMPKVT